MKKLKFLASSFVIGIFFFPMAVVLIGVALIGAIIQTVGVLAAKYE